MSAVLSQSNGVTQVIDSFEITRGIANELNFSYNEREPHYFFIDSHSVK